jgi:hypothetical protein
MPPNLRKSQPNLSKPSEGGSFNAGKKSSESTSPLSGLNLRGERELGSVGGIKATGRVEVGIDGLIGKQGVEIEIDATNRTAGFGAGIGSTKGKLGVNIGGKVGYDENGKLKVKSAEAGINIGGFGGSASIDEDEGIKGSVSVAGAKVEVGVGKDGKKTLSVCYGVPGGEVCVTFEPDPGTELPLPPGTPTPTPTPGGGTGGSGGSGGGGIGDEDKNWEKPIYPPGRPGVSCVVIFITKQQIIIIDKFWNPGDTSTYISTGSGSYDPITGVATVTGTYTVTENGIAKSSTKTVEGQLDWKQSDPLDYVVSGPASGYEGDESKIYERLAGAYLNATFENDYYIQKSTQFCTVIGGHCKNAPFPEAPDSGSPGSSSSNKARLPNYPQHFKPDMNCCDKVEEIYKYLGIGKLKKNKFPVSRAFLVPGGTGNDDCIDYYSIAQALFRMLANGLIINPKSRPHGSEWQSVNATGWASDMYAMMAESMSDGNSTQRFEVATIMQLVQIMATVAENGRKIECAIDAIGLEPLPVSEEIPVCFTIYEGHKGFGDKKPKKINVSKLKTDKAVENALGGMLSPSYIPIVTWKFKPGQISISEALRNG